MNGKREGKGKAVLASGDVMQGWFKDDEFTGEGVKTTSGGYVYSGVFERGFLNGNGRELAHTLIIIHPTAVEGAHTLIIIHPTAVEGAHTLIFIHLARQTHPCSLIGEVA
jgi:hypothetical protein